MGFLAPSAVLFLVSDVMGYCLHFSTLRIPTPVRGRALKRNANNNSLMGFVLNVDTPALPWISEYYNINNKK